VSCTRERVEGLRDAVNMIERGLLCALLVDLESFTGSAERIIGEAINTT